MWKFGWHIYYHGLFLEPQPQKGGEKELCLSHRSATSQWELFCWLEIKRCSFHVNHRWETSQPSAALSSCLFWDICYCSQSEVGMSPLNAGELVWSELWEKCTWGVSWQLLTLGLSFKVARCLTSRRPHRGSDLEQSTLRIPTPGAPGSLGASHGRKRICLLSN